MDSKFKVIDTAKKPRDELLWGIAFVTVRVIIMALGLAALNRWW